MIAAVGEGPLTGRVVEAVRRDGPMRFDRLMDLALYDPDAGFFATAGGAGRAGGDFVTAPEVGPLFGAVLAGALDDWWRELGEPQPFTVIEAGAGRGALARAVLAASPACLPALHYVAVERSDALRAQHPPSPQVDSRAALPLEPVTGVILANELLDNLAVRLVEWSGARWQEVAVGVDDDGALVEVLTEGDAASVDWATSLVAEPAPGARIPVQEQATAWLDRALTLLALGRLVVFDYGALTPDLARRPSTEWLRTYRGHSRGGHPLDDLGTQDITCEVALDQLAVVEPPTSDRSQAEFLPAHGLDQLVDEGRRIWQERAHLGDLEAMRARSRVTEAEALTDPAGMGAFRVLEWERR